MSDIPTISTVMEWELGNLKIDRKLATAVHQWLVSFINKNEDHTTFFGGNLTGVQVVRLKDSDRADWFSDILGTDQYVLEELIHSLDGINTAWHVSSDVFNISCMWLVHKFLTTPHLKDKEREQAAIDTLMILNCKYLTGVLTYFKYPANPDVAAATYARLSYKFALKKHGSWYLTLKKRSEDIIEHGGLHRGTLLDFTNDRDIVEMLNDTQGRIRDMMKNIYREFIAVNANKDKIKTTSSIVELDGKEILRDKTRGLVNYTRYIHSIVSDSSSFIKPEIIQVVTKIMHTMPEKVFTESLSWMSANYRTGSGLEIEELLDETLLHSFDYLSNQKTLVSANADLTVLVSKLKGVYMSSRSSDSRLLKMRKLGESVVKKAYKTKNDSMIASVRTGLLLYIVIRSYSMNHYSS